MKISLAIFAALIAVTSFAQPQPQQGQAPQAPQGQRMRAQGPPASPQNALQFSFGSFGGNRTVVDRIMYTGYAEANTHVSETDAVFIGDSITQNWYSFHHDFFDKNGFIARGIGGQTSISVLCRFRQDVVQNHPKLVLIMIGTNDVAQNDGIISDENFLDNVASMCDLAKANGIKVLLCSIPPCDNLSWNQEVTPGTDIIRLNGKLKEYAASEGIQYVDYYSALSNGKDGMKDEYTSDRCHPTPLGYNVMERVAVQAINKALNTSKDYFVTTD